MGKFFGWQILGLFVIIIWTAALCGLFFFAFHKFGLLRVTLMEEVIGLDISEMGVEEPKEFKMMDKDLTRTLTMIKKNESNRALQNYVF